MEREMKFPDIVLLLNALGIRGDASGRTVYTILPVFLSVESPTLDPAAVLRKACRPVAARHLGQAASHAPLCTKKLSVFVARNRG